MLEQVAVEPNPPEPSCNIPNLRAVLPPEMRAIAGFGVSNRGKILVNRKTGRPGGTGTGHWSLGYVDFEEAAAAVERLGPGFFISVDPSKLNMCVGDLDKIAIQNGSLTVEAWAQDIIAKSNTFCETSMSGLGTHLLMLSVADEIKGRVAPGVDVFSCGLHYGSGRHVALTGNHVAGTPMEMTDGTVPQHMIRDRRETLSATPSDGLRDSNGL
jgi:hypothetical protein